MYLLLRYPFGGPSFPLQNWESLIQLIILYMVPAGLGNAWATGLHNHEISVTYFSQNFSLSVAGFQQLIISLCRNLWFSIYASMYGIMKSTLRNVCVSQSFQSSSLTKRELLRFSTVSFYLLSSTNGNMEYDYPGMSASVSGLISIRLHPQYWFLLCTSSFNCSFRFSSTT